MFSAYMDETGHSADAKQKFNGIGGLFAAADEWIAFEEKWNATLARKEFNIPYFHMKDFEARDAGGRKSFFAGWSEAKRRRLFGKLLSLIASVHPICIGSIVHMDDYRALNESQRAILRDPYFLSFVNVIAYTTSFLDFVTASPDVKVGLIFSDQVEFRHRALLLYEDIWKVGMFIKRSAYPPDFRPMQDFPALQAADIVAYEMYKEYDRRVYRPRDKIRFGYGEIEKMNLRHGFKPMFRFYSKAELTSYALDFERAARHQAYWEKRKKLKDAS